MPFDPLAWGLGFVLTRLSDRLLQACSSDPLRSRLCEEALQWASELPGDLPKSYEHIFGGDEAEIIPETHPARFRLQSALKAAVTVPTEAEWFDALYEHWKERRSKLGEHANLFFQLSPDDADGYLSNLAKRMHRCCQQDTSLALPAMAKQLEELVSGQRLDATARQRRALVPQYARDLSATAQAVILDRPDAWEYRLFSEVLSSEIARHSSLRRDYDNGLFVGERVPLTDVTALLDWLQAQLSEAALFGRHVDLLINEELQRALGPPGVAGDAESIVYVAKKLGEIYRRSIEWSISLMRVDSDVEFSEILRLHSRLVSDMIEQMRVFSAQLARELSTAVAGEPRTISLTLTLTIPQEVTVAIDREFERLNELFA